MAFCWNNAGCGHSCGRQDAHGGDCDCYESDCKHSSRYKPAPVVPPEPAAPLATFYAVRCNGKYYHTYSRAGSTGWRDKVEDGKVWTRKGPAQAMVTKLSSVPVGPRLNAPQQPSVPELIEFMVTEVRVVDQAARVAEAKAKKEREDAARKATYREHEIVR